MLASSLCAKLLIAHSACGDPREGRYILIGLSWRPKHHGIRAGNRVGVEKMVLGPTVMPRAYVERDVDYSDDIIAINMASREENDWQARRGGS